MKDNLIDPEKSASADNGARKIFRDAEKVKLEKAKKNSIREAVLMFMKENPLESRKIGFWQKVFLPKLKPVYITISGLAVVLVVGSLASAKAQSALPGDPLYPVKVGFNEKVMQVLAFSDQAKVDLSVQLAEIRLEEAETLLAQGRITADDQVKISNNFNVQAEKVAKSLEKLNSTEMYDDAEKISSGFEASLKAHSQVLEKLRDIKDNNKKTAENIDSLINEVNSATTEALDSSTNSVDSVLSQPEAKVSAREKIAENRLESAEEAVAELENLIENEKDKISPEDLAKAEENLNEAEQKIAEGKDKISGEEKDFTRGLSLFQEARIIAKKSKSLMEAKAKFRVNLDID